MVEKQTMVEKATATFDVLNVSMCVSLHEMLVMIFIYRTSLHSNAKCQRPVGIFDQ